MSESFVERWNRKWAARGDEDIGTRMISCGDAVLPDSPDPPRRSIGRPWIRQVIVDLIPRFARESPTCGTIGFSGRSPRSAIIFRTRRSATFR
jgi:hypothetical protein